MTRIASGLLPFAALAASALLAAPAAAATFTAFYGDDDGFGVGATAGTMSADFSNAEPGEAPFTDIRLIGDCCSFPDFRPTGGFEPFVLDGPILSAALTLRLGAFGSLNPVSGPNVIRLNGLTVDPSFINGFTANDADFGQRIETRSINLDPSFFAALATGNVSLAGTRISEGSGYGSFQVDFVRLDITTDSIGAPIPEPSTWALLIAGFALVGAALRRRRRPRGSAAIA